MPRSIEEGQALLVTVEGQRIILTQPGQYASGTRNILKGAWGGKKPPSIHTERREGFLD